MPESKRRGQEVGGGAGGCSQDKWKLKKGGSRSAIPALFTITEEDEGRKRKNASRKKKRGMKGKLKKKHTHVCVCVKE